MTEPIKNNFIIKGISRTLEKTPKWLSITMIALGSMAILVGGMGLVTQELENLHRFRFIPEWASITLLSCGAISFVWGACALNKKTQYPTYKPISVDTAVESTKFPTTSPGETLRASVSEEGGVLPSVTPVPVASDSPITKDGHIDTSNLGLDVESSSFSTSAPAASHSSMQLEPISYKPKITDPIAFMNYRWNPPGAYWVEFDNFDPPIIIREKFHITIDRNKLDQAIDILLPILKEENVQSFKFATKLETTNTIGKEFVIYVSRDKTTDQWRKLIDKIEKALKDEGIASGTPSYGDLSFLPPYFYVRIADNVLKQYISTELLGNCGFTTLERAKLGGAIHELYSSKLEEAAAKLSLHASKLSEKVFDVARKARIKAIMTRDLEKWFIQLVTGDGNREGYCEKPEIHILERYVVTRGSTSLISKKYLIWESALKLSEFDTYLERAATVAAHYCNAENVGSIMPAIYFHLIWPLAIHKEINEENLILEMIKCALRQRVAFPKNINFDEESLKQLSLKVEATKKLEL